MLCSKLIFRGVYNCFQNTPGSRCDKMWLNNIPKMQVRVFKHNHNIHHIKCIVDLIQGMISINSFLWGIPSGAGFFSINRISRWWFQILFYFQPPKLGKNNPSHLTCACFFFPKGFLWSFAIFVFNNLNQHLGHHKWCRIFSINSSVGHIIKLSNFNKTWTWIKGMHFGKVSGNQWPTSRLGRQNGSFWKKSRLCWYKVGPLLVV